MFVLYIYLFSLLVMLYLTVNAALVTANYVPIKIKAVSLVVLSAAFLRILCLLYLFFTQKIVFLYLLKPVAFINMLYIPIIGFICIYIFMRNDKIKFSYTFIIYILLAVLYILFIYKEPFQIRALQDYGYGFYFSKNMISAFGFIAINTIILVLGIMQLGKPVANNFGLSIIVISSLVSIADTFLNLFGFEYMAQNIMGEVLYLIVFNYGLSRLKK